MLAFRYTCQRHQQLFIDAVTRAGCADPKQMDDVRRRLLAWFSQRYPSLVLDHFHLETCLGCEVEARFGSLSDIAQAIEQIVSQPTPPIRRPE